MLEQHLDLEMLRRPHLWPHGGRIVPIKRRSKPDLQSYDQYAVVLHVGQHGKGVHADESIYMVCFDRLLPEFSGLTSEQTQAMLRDGEPPVFGGDFLMRTLVDAGWLVD